MQIDTLHEYIHFTFITEVYTDKKPMCVSNNARGNYYIHTQAQLLSSPISPIPSQTLVAIDGHEAISLIVGIGTERSVDGDLLEVGTETMTMGVVI